MINVALHTGLRRGELFALKWNTVDFNTALITIPRTKSGETRRVPMNGSVAETLRNLPGRMRNEYVFTSKAGTPLNPQNFINRVFGPALRRGGISYFRWHDLRHTFASRLVMAGVDLRTVQELLGHKTIAMTLRYSHLSPRHLQAVVEGLSRELMGVKLAPLLASTPRWVLKDQLNIRRRSKGAKLFWPIGGSG